MSISLLLENLFNPPVLFFFLGMVAAFVKSDLDIPTPIAKFLSLYLMLAIGFKGGVELTHSGLTPQIGLTLGLALLLASVMPIYVFFMFRKRVGVYNAGGVAATYGSVSAVTFITAIAFLEVVKVIYGGHMVAALALMESPALIVGVLLIRKFNPDKEGESEPIGAVLKEAVTNGSVFLLLGSLVIGMITGNKGTEALEPFTNDIFKGMLALFMLDMGILAAKRIRALRTAGWPLIAFAIIAPLIHGCLAVMLASACQFSPGNALLFSVLVAGASYIAVPAAFRMAVPEANPGLYVPMALAITFPVNILVGIPLYYQLILLLN
ncbi:MAG TPA: sodium-dependent bicarbonate transport family permease [Cytophagales bacterium]|nr:sodium-dependent bicarbonate transport family permease [Cytophagales bacterium]